MWLSYTFAEAGRVSSHMRGWIARRSKLLGGVMRVRNAYALGAVAAQKEMTIIEVQKEEYIEVWGGSHAGIRD
jgi:hypothetical protein